MPLRTFLACLFVAFSAQVMAWTPQGWVYWQEEFAYSHNQGGWYYVDRADTLPEVNLRNGQWRDIDQNSGWLWFAWPYFLEAGNGTAHWVSPDQHYAVNLSSGEWSQIGTPTDSEGSSLIDGPQ